MSHLIYSFTPRKPSSTLSQHFGKVFLHLSYAASNSSKLSLNSSHDWLLPHFTTEKIHPSAFQTQTSLAFIHDLFPLSFDLTQNSSPYPQDIHFSHYPVQLDIFYMLLLLLSLIFCHHSSPPPYFFLGLCHVASIKEIFWIGNKFMHWPVLARTLSRQNYQNCSSGGKFGSLTLILSSVFLSIHSCREQLQARTGEKLAQIMPSTPWNFSC